MKTFGGTFQKNTAVAIGGEVSRYVLVGSNGVIVELGLGGLDSFNAGSFLGHNVDVTGDYIQVGVERKRWVFDVSNIRTTS